MSKIDSYYIAKKHGMLDSSEIDVIKYCMYKILEITSTPLIINIGAGYGTSAMAMLEAVPEAFIFSIDPHQQPHEADFLASAGLEPARVLRILSTSQKAGKFFPFDAELIFVDGAHSDEAVLKDIELWKPKVKPGGFMLFHDYNHPNIPSLTVVVEGEMNDWKAVRTARYLIAYQNTEQ